MATPPLRRICSSSPVETPVPQLPRHGARDARPCRCCAEGRRSEHAAAPRTTRRRAVCPSLPRIGPSLVDHEREEQGEGEDADFGKSAVRPLRRDGIEEGIGGEVLGGRSVVAVVQEGVVLEDRMAARAEAYGGIWGSLRGRVVDGGVDVGTAVPIGRDGP